MSNIKCEHPGLQPRLEPDETGHIGAREIDAFLAQCVGKIIQTSDGPRYIDHTFDPDGEARYYSLQIEMGCCDDLLPASGEEDRSSPQAPEQSTHLPVGGTPMSTVKTPVGTFTDNDLMTQAEYVARSNHYLDPRLVKIERPTSTEVCPRCRSRNFDVNTDEGS